jgi:DNA-binding XRE family transcriptional regulator
LDQAKLTASEKGEIAQMLGVSRQTLFEWEREMKQKAVSESPDSPDD